MLYQLMRRAFYFVFSFIGFVLFSPLMLGITILIEFDSLGSAFYKSTRVGEDGKPFKMLKFRTMVTNADKIGVSSTSDDDPRITHVGRFLHTYKLNELPQLINVLKGEMSFVGPRPEKKKRFKLFARELPMCLSLEC